MPTPIFPRSNKNEYLLNHFCAFEIGHTYGKPYIACASRSLKLGERAKVGQALTQLPPPYFLSHNPPSPLRKFCRKLGWGWGYYDWGKEEGRRPNEVSQKRERVTYKTEEEQIFFPSLYVRESKRGRVYIFGFSMLPCRIKKEEDAMFKIQGLLLLSRSEKGFSFHSCEAPPPHSLFGS